MCEKWYRYSNTVKVIDMKKEKYFKECPEQHCKELSETVFKEINNFYKSVYDISLIYKIIFDFVCSFDRTLLTLIVGSLTSLSINLATGFINLESGYSKAEIIFRILQFIFSCGFNIYTIRFVAKVINIQECGEKYIPNEQFEEDLILGAQKNVMFYACMKNKEYLMKYVVRGGICLLIIIISVPSKFFCVNSINQVILFFSNLFNDIIKFCKGV